jgi:hypothetical protein
MLKKIFFLLSIILVQKSWGQKPRLQRIIFNCAHPQQSYVFYQKIFSGKIIFNHKNSSIVVSKITIQFIQDDSSNFLNILPQNNREHIAFLSDNLKNTTKILRKHNIFFITNKFFLNKKKYTQIFFNDPNGHQIEILISNKKKSNLLNNKINISSLDHITSTCNLENEDKLLDSFLKKGFTKVPRPKFSNKGLWIQGKNITFHLIEHTPNSCATKRKDFWVF